jgi:uncharacterized protein (TIGR00297 family)
VDRKLNWLFSFLLVVVFIFAASTSQQWSIISGLILAGLFSFLAFLGAVLTLDGMFAAIVVGTFIFGLGGWQTAAIVLLFFVSSSLISGENEKDKVRSVPVRRDGLQVWSNGFWFVVCLILFAFEDNNVFLIAALAAIATATADTWGTELGSKFYRSTFLITDFSNVEPGTDGGISLKGTIASLFGSLIIWAASIYVFSLQFAVFLCIFTAGFLGSLVDSYFGATFQRNNDSVSLPVLQTKISIDNNLVNGISTGVGAILAIILNWILI